MIIILNGPQNSGKTTIAKILQSKIQQSAHIEVDGLRKFIYWMEGDDAFSISIENAILVAKNLANKGLCVIVSYIFSNKELKYINQELSKLKNPIYIYTFSPQEKICLTNRGTRELKEKEINRIKYHYNVGINKPSIGKIIDNSNQKATETTAIIMRDIQNEIKNIKTKFKVRTIENHI